MLEMNSNTIKRFAVALLVTAACSGLGQVREARPTPPIVRGGPSRQVRAFAPEDINFELQPASPLTMPAPVDSNSPAFWVRNELYLLNSAGGVRRSQGSDQSDLSAPENAHLVLAYLWPTWIEAVWRDSNGVLFAWYHQEQHGVCDGIDLAVPRIGAAVSFDDGKNYQDLGIVLESGDGVDCTAQNGYFAGGHGDFSVVLDQRRQFFYFLFSNYGGPLENQGVAVARMAFADRYNPAGHVWKYFEGDWSEPGLNGRVTPAFPANVAWQSAETDAFWGPSVHWNSYLESYVVLLNHSCCAPGWPQEGVYISFNSQLSDPSGWTAPQQVMGGGRWYPQILGVAPGETDRFAGRVARFYMYGRSDFTIVFSKPGRVRDATPGEVQ